MGVMFSRKDVPCSSHSTTDRILGKCHMRQPLLHKASLNIEVILVMSESANVLQVWLVDFINEFFHFP